MSIEAGADTPMTYYYAAWMSEGAEKTEWLLKAEACCGDYCFPNRMEDILALQDAIGCQCGESAEGRGAAPYYLGCLYYDKRQYDLASANWKLSSELNPAFPTVWRNLALYYYNKQHDAAQALECLEKAFALDRTDARIYMELDQLYKKLGRQHSERLAIMQQHLDMVEVRDDLRLEYATLLNLNGRYEEAMQFIDAHTFHVWEGGEGKVPAQYQLARTELAKQKLKGTQTDITEAVRLLEECLQYPWHLGEGKLYGAQENDFYYFLGCAHDALGDKDNAVECWEKATLGSQEPAAAMYYNDAKPEKIFYQGLAFLRLGRIGEANGRFYKLINYGKQHIFDDVVMDYFAVSLPDLQIWEGDLNLSNQIHCKFMLALGYYGLALSLSVPGCDGHLPSQSAAVAPSSATPSVSDYLLKAKRYLSEVEQLDINHLGIYALRTLMG